MAEHHHGRGPIFEHVEHILEGAERRAHRKRGKPGHPIEVLAILAMEAAAICIVVLAAIACVDFALWFSADFARSMREVDSDQAFALLGALLPSAS